MANKYFKAVVLLPLFFLYCASPHNQTSSYQLGKIEFTATGKKAAKPFFEKGLLLLHSFEYVDAAEEFIKARELDPDFVMAYWGEAMTYNHPLWRYQNFEKATEVLKKLAPSPEERVNKAKTELEKDFIKSIDVLYGKGTKAERDIKYAAYMESLYKKYAGNPEVASFYSVALIGSVETGRDNKIYEKAAEIAKEVLSKNPTHPGALHYMIHAYDDPDHAALAIATADKYSGVAPDAGHALHMPTHIYLALGMWDKVVSSNITSWQAGINRKLRKNLTNDALNYHAFHWLEYGYLQRGNIEEAGKMVKEMKNYCSAVPSSRARSHMVFLKTTYLVETNDYNSDVANIEFNLDDLNIVTRSMNHFVNGMQAFYKMDKTSLDDIIRTMTNQRLIDQERVSGNGGRICGNVNAEMPTMLDLQQAEVMELELKAMQAWLQKDIATTERFLKQAVGIETNISYAYGPPSIIKPSFELYGEWLLETNRPKEALVQFEQSLKIAPKRILSIKGKEKVLKVLG